MPIKLQKRVLEHVNTFFPEANDRQRKKLFKKYYESAQASEDNEKRYKEFLNRERAQIQDTRRKELQDELDQEAESQAQNEEAAAPYGAKPIDYYQMRLKALGLDKESQKKEAEAKRTIKIEDGKAVGVPEMPGAETEEDAMSPQEKRALEIRKKYSELGTGNIPKEAEELEQSYGTWGRRAVNIYNGLMRGIDVAIDSVPFLDADNSEELKAVNEEARKKFPGGSLNPFKDLADWVKRSGYRYNQYYTNKYPTYNHKVDEFDITKPDAGTAFYLAVSNLAELAPSMLGGGEALALEKAGVKYFGKEFGKKIATKYGEQLAKKGASKLVVKAAEKGTEILASTPKNAGAFYRYTFDHHLDDLVNNQGYSLDDPNTYKRAAQKSAVESAFEGVFDQFSFAKESPELLQGLLGGKKAVYKQLGKNVLAGGAASGAEEMTQSASTLPFEIADAKAQINIIKNKVANGEIDPQQAQEQIAQLEFTAGKIAKQLAGDAVVGVLTPVVMKMPNAIGYSIGPVEQKALGVAMNNEEEFKEALDAKVAKKKMSAEEAERMRSFYDQVKTQYDRALTLNAPVSYQRKKGLKKMNSTDALKLAVEAARFNSLSTEFTLATDDKTRKDIKDKAALSMQTMANIRNGVDISKRRVSSEEIASIVSGQTPRGNFSQGQSEKIMTKSGFQQESIESEEDLRNMVENDAEALGYVMDIRSGRLKVNVAEGGNIVLDEANTAIDGKKRLAQRYVDSFYGNQDEVERNRQAALESSNLAYNNNRRRFEQKNFADEEDERRTLEFLANPVEELKKRLSAVEERILERKAQRFQGIQQQGGLSEQQLEKDAQELRDEIAKHEEIETGAANARVQGEFVPFIVTKAVSGQETVNTALASMAETDPNDLENSFLDLDSAIAAEVTQLQTDFTVQKEAINTNEYSGTPEEIAQQKESAMEGLLYNYANQLALAGIKYDDLSQALSNVTGISPLIAEGVIKHMAKENMLPTSDQIMAAVSAKAALAVENNKEMGQTEADVNMSPEDDAAIEAIENSATQAMMQIPTMARLLTWANNAIVNSKSQEEKTDASVLLNDPVAFLKAEIARKEQEINEVQSPDPQEAEAIVKELNGQLKELTDALAQVEQIDAISEAKKDEVMDGVEAKVLAEKAAGEPVAGEQVKPTRVQEIKYQIEQLENAINARIQDLVSKGATLKEATDIANKEMSEEDKKALSLLKDELNQIAQSGVVEKDKSEREKRADDRETNKELTKNLTNIFNQMGVESPKRKKKNCP